jgi:4-hydroxythreonine-4-phosphate dehydrogenase
MFLATAPHCPPLPVIAVTLGDLSGVGAELSLKVAQAWVHERLPAYQLRFYGDVEGANAQADALGLASLERLGKEHPTLISWVHTPAESSGKASYLAVEAAVLDALAGKVLGVVTNPISKANWWKAGVPYSGHTEALEMLANRHADPSQKLFQAPFQADMFFAFQNFRLLLLTRHVPLQAVSTCLDLNQAKASVEALIHTLKATLAKETFRLALLGVNPHAGEIGGVEEAEMLLPLQAWVHEQFPYVTMSLPQPADAFFRGFDAQSTKGFDAVVSPYHDQGLIPMKLLAGFDAVNVTIGLPFLRTSVSHGMASDIAGQGVANPRSLQAAIDYVWDAQRTAPNAEGVNVYYEPLS